MDDASIWNLAESLFAVFCLFGLVIMELNPNMADLYYNCKGSQPFVRNSELFCLTGNYSGPFFELFQISGHFV